ncbi:O-acyltransferase [Forsythia ovata]|uniref:O-acyltransferase n=1 Tax=Forsythia ovata TaxID=205694 RepID=A0ABD1PZ48_9LAMI
MAILELSESVKTTTSNTHHSRAASTVRRRSSAVVVLESESNSLEVENDSDGDVNNNSGMGNLCGGVVELVWEKPSESGTEGLTEAGKKAKKAVESAVDDAVKKHKNKGKINPDYYNNVIALREMNSNRGEGGSSSATRSGKNGSVFPKEKEHVSTMVGKKIAEVAKKAVESAIDAVNKHNKKGKISPDN